MARVAARQHGRITTGQLASCGLDGSAVRRRVRMGYLHRVHRGVYTVGHAGATLHALFMQAVLAGGEGAALSHWASAALWDLVRWDGRDVDVTVRGSGGRLREGILFHRSRSRRPRDVTRHYGMRVTTPARALLEIAPQLSDHRLRRVVRKAEAERRGTLEQIADVLSRANGHRATRRLAAIVADGPIPTRSGHEDAVLDVILGAGLQRPQINQRLVACGTTYDADLRWPAQRLILEVDSAWHDGRVAREDDGDRQADLEAAGERVLRTTRRQAVADPRRLIARLAAAGAPYTHPRT